MGLDDPGSDDGKEGRHEVVRGLLHTGLTGAPSRTSRPLSTPFPILAYSTCDRVKALHKGGHFYARAASGILWALLAALMTLSSAQSLVFKPMHRSLVIEAIGIAWVVGGFGLGRCK